MSEIEGEYIPVGVRANFKGYVPSENLKQTMMTFAHACKQKCPHAIIEFGQTDRDVEINIRVKQQRTMFYRHFQYYVWEENSQVVGAKAGSLNL